MNKYNFTIIIPHYNIPDLLERCVSSIPIREDLQIIIVDDCSTNIIELNKVLNRISSHRNIEIYKTNKSGSAGRARNLGLEYAKGNWLLFADSDDFFDESLSDFLNKYKDATQEIIYFNFKSVLSSDIKQKSNREFTYNDFFNQYRTNHNEENFRFLYCAPWGKMIKKDFVFANNIKFDETRYANDAMFSVLIGCKAKSILVDDSPIYILTERNGSLANNFCRKPGETIIRTKVALRVYKTIKEHNFKFDYDYKIYIRLLLWNKEYNDLLDIYKNIADYGISKASILKIIYNTGYRYYITCIWLIFRGGI